MPRICVVTIEKWAAGGCALASSGVVWRTRVWVWRIVRLPNERKYVGVV
jgi:hypothetical protein